MWPLIHFEGEGRFCMISHSPKAEDVKMLGHPSMLGNWRKFMPQRFVSSSARTVRSSHSREASAIRSESKHCRSNNFRDPPFPQTASRCLTAHGRNPAGATGASRMLGGEPKSLGKPDALQLAGRSLWDLRKKNHLSGRLEVGKPRCDEVPDLALGGVSAFA